MNDELFQRRLIPALTVYIGDSLLASPGVTGPATKRSKITASAC